MRKFLNSPHIGICIDLSKKGFKTIQIEIADNKKLSVKLFSSRSDAFSSRTESSCGQT